jgi:DNA-binding response OmpR family regulator
MPDSRLRVLMIEDTLADVQLVQRLLARSRLPVFDLRLATDLNQGTKALKAGAFDAVILDLGLPDSTGAGTVSRLRDADPDIPAVVLTVTDTPRTVLDSIRMGAQDYFVKSRLGDEELIHKIVDAVVRRHVLSGGPLASAAPHRAGGKIIRVLIVEDDEADASLLRRMLSTVKLVRIQVVHAVTLEQAMSHLSAGVDIVLLDLNLPDRTGLGTLRHLRATDQQTPVVILTGVEDRQTAVAALESGGQDYLVKGHVDGISVGRSIMRQLRAPGGSEA